MVDARVLVVGGGAIGGVSAAKMAGHVRAVVVLDADAEHVAAMRDPGLRFVERGEEQTVRLDAVSSPDDLEGRFDFALLAVKAGFHRAAVEPLAARDAADAYVTMGNGLIQERIAGMVGEERLLACLVEWGGDNLGPGRLVRDTVAPMVVGELDGSERDRTRLLARCLGAVGEVRISHNIRGQIWSKLLVNSTFTGLSAISGLRYGAVADHPRGRLAAYAVWTEGVGVAEAEGAALERVLDVDPDELVVRSDADHARAEAALGRLMAIAGNTRPSMLQDVERHRATEVDVVCGGVAGRGRAHGIPTPCNDAIVALVHRLETGDGVPDPAHFDAVLAAGS
jgi:2-dehydropantoate 2-reductase